jgi:hypothetical protein
MQIANGASTTCSFAMLGIFYISFLLSIVLLHFEKDNRHGLLNSSRLRLVFYCWEEKMKSIDAKYQIQVGYWKEPIPKL